MLSSEQNYEKEISLETIIMATRLTDLSNENKSLRILVSLASLTDLDYKNLSNEDSFLQGKIYSLVVGKTFNQLRVFCGL